MARTMKHFMTETEQLAHAKKVLYRGLVILGLVWIIGVGVLIYIGETTLWASSETKAALPSLEIVP
jgi:hypothetical protein